MDVNSTKETAKQLDFSKIFRTLAQHRKMYALVLPAVAVLAYLFILSVPRYYRSEVKLAAEAQSAGGGVVAGMASSLGFDLSSGLGNGDALQPELYPQIIESTDFRTQLFGIPLQPENKEWRATYYDYLLYKQKKTWWEMAFGAVMRWFEKPAAPAAKLNPFKLTKEQYGIAELIGSKVKCVVDKKTSVIIITVEDQDPYIAAVMADTVRTRLQRAITEYRTGKARNDLRTAEKLAQQAKSRYERTRQRYAAFSDNNNDIVLQSYRLKGEEMENDMQLEYNAYTAYVAQMNNARARLQERTPAFTTLQAATVPVKPAGPKRMVFALAVMLVAALGMSGYYLRKGDIFATV